MSIDQRKVLGEFVKYVLYAALAVSGWLIKEAAVEARSEIHELRNDISDTKEQLQKDISAVKERVIRLETKIEDANN